MNSDTVLHTRLIKMVTPFATVHRLIVVFRVTLGGGMNIFYINIH